MSGQIVEDIKQDVFQVEFSVNEINKKETSELSGDNILGELLCYLRENKLMSTLMVCRQIEKIQIEDNVCELCSQSNDIEILVSNEKHKLELDKFFKSKSLGFKIQEKNQEKSKVDLLREFFGDKLTVE